MKTKRLIRSYIMKLTLLTIFLSYRVRLYPQLPWNVSKYIYLAVVGFMKEFIWRDDWIWHTPLYYVLLCYASFCIWFTRVHSLYPGFSHKVKVGYIIVFIITYGQLDQNLQRWNWLHEAWMHARILSLQNKFKPYIIGKNGNQGGLLFAVVIFVFDNESK